MKKIKFIRHVASILPALLLAMVLITGYSCSKDVVGEISISSSDITLTNADNQRSVDVVTDGKWSVSGYPGWITVSPTSGSGRATIKITVSENDTPSQRKASIVISADGAREEIKVTQQKVEFTISQSAMVFDEQGTSQQMKIVSNSSWEISRPTSAAWCDISPMQGKGDAMVTFTPKSAADRVKREKVIIKVRYSTSFAQLVISQDILNSAPSAPELTFPENNATGVTVIPVVQWNSSTDADGDKVTYSVYFSKSDTDWTEKVYENITKSLFSPAGLNKNTLYYWKVVAKDQFGGESTSQVWKFTTGDVGAYAEGEVKLYEANTNGARPVNLVVVGDGFIEADYVDGGAFDLAANEAIEAFLGVEPYVTYRDYFKVQKVAAFSQERGATIKGSNNANTIFKSTLEGGGSTGISCDYDKVYSYVKNADGITDNELTKMTVIVVININMYAGTCLMYSDGRSIAMCPIDRSSTDGFKKLVSHEAGGHGFGRLGDEYIYYDRSIPANEKDEREQWAGLGYYQNMTFSSDPSRVVWRDFIGRSNYSTVGMFQGGFFYSEGVWRPEFNSCMNNNIPYYNVASRYAIYKRIKSVVGETPSFSDFISRDMVKTNPFGSATRSPEVFVPLAPPIMIKVN